MPLVPRPAPRADSIGTDTNISACVPAESQYGVPGAQSFLISSDAQSGASGTGRGCAALVATTWP